MWIHRRACRRFAQRRSLVVDQIRSAAPARREAVESTSPPRLLGFRHPRRSKCCASSGSMFHANRDRSLHEGADPLARLPRSRTDPHGGAEIAGLCRPDDVLQARPRQTRRAPLKDVDPSPPASRWLDERPHDASPHLHFATPRQGRGAAQAPERGGSRATPADRDAPPSIRLRTCSGQDTAARLWTRSTIQRLAPVPNLSFLMRECDREGMASGFTRPRRRSSGKRASRYFKLEAMGRKGCWVRMHSAAQEYEEALREDPPRAPSKPMDLAAP